MLYSGKNITAPADPLEKITVDELFRMIQSPDNDLVATVRQLRTVRSLNNKQYTQLKKMLPYIVCGCFNPPYRKTENFTFIEYFFVDIDHLSTKGYNITTIKNKIKRDSRARMIFVSPSEDGLKVLFHLSEKCHDAGVFKLFYRKFVEQFAQQHELEQTIDSVTNDVTRACFVSIDSEAFYNPFADDVDMKAFINPAETLEMFDMKHDMDKEIKEEKKAHKEEEKQQREPDDAAMDRIKELLLTKKQQQKIRNTVEVPEQLEIIITSLKQFIEDQGIDVYDVENIQFAKRIKCRLGLKLAEVNLFYGKKGFSVVQSPRSGTNAELNQIVAEIIQIYLSENA